jgi:hypothetical protein
LSTLPPSYQATVVATFDEKWAAASGFSALTQDGIAVLGHFSGTDFQNYLHAVPQALHQGALRAQKPFKLAEQSQVFVGGDLFRIAGFGRGVALHRGSYDMETWEPQTRDISFLPLSMDGVKVKAGALSPVLKARGTGTQVLHLASLGKELLVMVKDVQGKRLVRLRRQE